MNKFVNAMFEDLRESRDFYAALRDEIEKSKEEKERIAKRIELLERLLAVDAPAGEAGVIGQNG